jgi:general secretion pathway protein D
LPNHGTPTLLLLAQQTRAGARTPAGGDTEAANARTPVLPPTNIAATGPGPAFTPDDKLPEETRFYRLSERFGSPKLPALERAITNSFTGSKYSIDLEHHVVVARGTPEQLAVMEKVIAEFDSNERLVQDGKLLYEMGKLNEAEAKLVQAWDQEPNNQTAAYFFNLVEQAMRQREVVAKSKLIEVEKAWNPPPLVSTQLVTRTYRVDPNALIQNPRAVHGDATNTPPGPSSAATAVPFAKALRDYFAAAGVDFGDGPVGSAATNAPVGGFQGPGGKALFFKERTGMLLVRATLADLDLIDQAIQVLNDAPPQVVIEAKFVEITEDTGKGLGFDWFLDTIGTNAPATTNGTATSAVFPGNPSLNAAVATNGPPGFNWFLGAVRTNTPAATPGAANRGVFPATATAGVRGSTNAVKELRGDQLDWVGKDVTNAHNLRVTAALGAQFRGILTEAQAKVVLRALEQRAGTDVLSAPKVTTLSGRQAQIQVVDLKTYVMGLDPKAVVQPGKRPAGATNASPFLTAQVPTGPTLDVIPTVAADGYTIELKVIPTVTEFLGYDDPRMFQPQGGKSEALLPLPHFRVWQMETTARIWDGQTLVLGGLTSDEVQKTKDSVPVLGDLPLVGSLFRSESQQTVKKRLLVFVTATITDPAGNRVHSPGELPFDPNAVPSQAPVTPR